MKLPVSAGAGDAGSDTLVQSQYCPSPRRRGQTYGGSQSRRRREVSRSDDLRPADESPGDEQAGAVGFRSGPAWLAQASSMIQGVEVTFEGVNRSLEHAAFGVDAADVKISLVSCILSSLPNSDHV